LVILFDWSQIL